MEMGYATTSSGFVRPVFASKEDKWAWFNTVRQRYFGTASPPGPCWIPTGNIEGRVASVSGDQPLRTLAWVDCYREGSASWYYPKVNLKPHGAIPLELKRQGTLDKALSAATHALFYRAIIPLEHLPLFSDFPVEIGSSNFYDTLANIPWKAAEFRWDSSNHFSAWIPCPKARLGSAPAFWEPQGVTLFRVEAVSESLWALVPSDPMAAAEKHKDHYKSCCAANAVSSLVESGYLLSSKPEALRALVTEWVRQSYTKGYQCYRSKHLVVLVWTHLQWAQRHAMLQALTNVHRPDFYEESNP